MRGFSLGLIVLAMLTGCGASGSDPAKLDLVKKNGQFSGTAGANWSDEELRSNAYGVLCAKNQKVVNLKIARDSDGTATISGNCV